MVKASGLLGWAITYSLNKKFHFLTRVPGTVLVILGYIREHNLKVSLYESGWGGDIV